MKLTMLSGLPASGKSTLARELVKQGAGRVNRDDLRQMVFSGKWSPKNEKIIIEIEKAIARELLSEGRDVVIDDTNLTAKHNKLWEDFCREQTFLRDIFNEPKVTLEKQTLNIDYQTCIQRDSYRTGSAKVGANVITKMALRNGLIQWPDKDIVLVDIDGTLANGEHRQHFVKREKKDWDSYFAALGNDRPHVHIFKWVAELGKDYTIVIVSGRGAEHEDQTKAWFDYLWHVQDDEDVPYFKPFVWLFRDKNDRRPDTEIKSEFLKLLPRKPVLVLDDRPAVCRMWKNNGLFCIPVAGACEEF